ncbi:MAG: glycosyltransferase [Planctomycetes bacterium]|nr:glycosyltransferase [Planctomycetota bacterium]
MPYPLAFLTGQPLVDGAAIAVAVFWVLCAFLVRRGARAIPVLGEAPGEPAAPSGGWPRASLVVASRDEEEHVGEATSSLLRLDYPDYEVIAVDDRSRDRTGAILEELARGDPRLRVERVGALPEGWIGKHHALHRGAAAATGAWILFADADVRLSPGALKLAVAHALEEDLDLLSLMPRNETRSVWMKAFYSAAVITMILVLGCWAHRRGRQSLVASAAGAFILVRRRAYERAGGHEPIRLVLIDDIALAMHIRRRGGRTAIAMGREHVRVPWSRDLPQLFRVLRKNGFALFFYNWLLLALFTLAVVAINTVAPVAMLLHGPLWPCAAAMWIAIFDAYRTAGRLVGASPLHALLHPFLGVIGILPAWFSAVAVTREGGVRWRDSFYPLAMLRKSL